MHDLPRICAGLCNHVIFNGHAAGQWLGPFEWKTWTIDWMGYSGRHWGDYTFKGARSPVFRREERTGTSIGPMSAIAT
ncbi:MAG TPA: hypothetical protein VEJ63_23375 [Planctomycetota bacterium]|nr:hypothetical protein [Planctomycetota bacterium]